MHQSCQGRSSGVCCLRDADDHSNFAKSPFGEEDRVFRLLVQCVRIGNSRSDDVARRGTVMRFDVRRVPDPCLVWSSLNKSAAVAAAFVCGLTLPVSSPPVHDECKRVQSSTRATGIWATARPCSDGRPFSGAPSYAASGYAALWLLAGTVDTTQCVSACAPSMGPAGPVPAASPEPASPSRIWGDEAPDRRRTGRGRRSEDGQE